MTTSRRVVVTRSGAPDVLEVREVEVPLPGAGQVRVASEVIGVAYGDVMRRRGVLRPPWAFTPGYDLVGRIDAVGPGGDPTRIGRRVAVLMPTIGLGAYADHVCVAEDLPVDVPDGVDAETAVGLGLNYITAWQILHRQACVAAGQTVLVHGASGGVGSALVDLSVRAGLTVLGTASAHKHDTVRSRGAVPIDYRHEDVEARAHELCPGGVDLVTDPLGGAHLDESARALRRGGTLVFFGITGDLERGALALLGGLTRVLRLKLKPGLRVHAYGIGIPPASSHSKAMEDWARVLDLGAGGLRPLIDSHYDLDRVADAHARLESGTARGRILLTTVASGAT